MSRFFSFRFSTDSFAATSLAAVALAALAATVAGCHPPAGEAPLTKEPAAAASNEDDPSAEDDPIFTPEQLQEDLRVLYADLEAAHFDLFVHTPKSTYDTRFEELLDQLDAPLDAFAAATTFQRFMAIGRIGHARIDFPHGVYADYQAAGGTSAPFFFRVKDDRVWVTESYAEPTSDALRPGDEILTLDGRPMAEWLEELRAHISSESAYMAHALLEFWFPRLLWLEVGEKPVFTLEVRTPGEEPKTVKVGALGQERRREIAADAPERLQLDWNGRSARVLDGGVAYLRPGPFYEPESAGGYDPTAFAAFLDEAFEDFLAQGADDLIIDLRDNPGGDNSFSDLMVAWFADRPFRFCSSFRVKVSPQTRASHRERLELNPNLEDGLGSFTELYAQNPDGSVVDYEMPFAEPRDGRRFDGEVYVLINRHSFSNAVTVAALIQDFGFGTVIGEKTSDLATSYGAMEHFTLPHTGLRVGYPKALLVRPNGDERLRGVTPDVEIEIPLVQGPEDPVLQEALAVVAAREGR